MEQYISKAAERMQEILEEIISTIASHQAIIKDLKEDQPNTYKTTSQYNYAVAVIYQYESKRATYIEIAEALLEEAVMTVVQLDPNNLLHDRLVEPTYSVGRVDSV